MREMTLSDLFGYGNGWLDPVPTKPWRLDGWVWATNGHILVAFKDDGRDADETPEGKRKGAHYLTDQPTDAQRVSFATLQAFTGPVAVAEACQDCEGSGRGCDNAVECEHCGKITRVECVTCGGDGHAPFEKRYARVCGAPVNLALLAYAFALVPADEMVTIGTVRTDSKNIGNVPVLVVDGADWRIVLMSLREVDANVPVFTVPEEAQIGSRADA